MGVCPRQRSHFRIWGPEGLMNIFYCLIFETSPTWRLRSPYLCSSVTEWPSYSWVIGFSSHYLVWLAGLRCRYSNPPPHGLLCFNIDVPVFIGRGEVFRFTQLLPPRKVRSRQVGSSGNAYILYSRGIRFHFQPRTDYSEWGFSYLSSVPPSKYLDSTWNRSRPLFI
jgi:hypothetical protein